MNKHLAGRFAVAALLGLAAMGSYGAELRINIPKSTKPTPVQQLNREGVKAVQKHQLERAEKLFFKAYLIDPDDPFTLNNLGYISELQGRVERAERYYELAAQHQSETVIDQASVEDLKGKPLAAVQAFVGNRDLAINRANVEAMSLLQQGRTQEAEQSLLQALSREPKNPFTLNNLGYTMEAEGNLDSAVRYYTQAAELNSKEKIVVALDPHWRGREISEVAGNNAQVVRKRMDTEQGAEARAARLNLQGVFALNHNQPEKAREDFVGAFKLDPYSAFSLNNMGYVSELNGDQETADEFYGEARQATGAKQKVTAANHAEMQGMSLDAVASNNSQDTEATLEASQEIRRRQGGAIELRRRDNQPIIEPEATQPAPSDQNAPNQVPRPPAGQSSPPTDQVPRPPQ